MNEDSTKLKANHAKGRLIGAIGAGLGVAAGLALGELIDFKSFWLGLVLVVGCAGLGIFLAQNIARK